MDVVRVSAINASAVEEVQDTTREVLSISAPGFAVTTIRCFCRHLDKRDLLDYSPRTIGA